MKDSQFYQNLTSRQKGLLFISDIAVDQALKVSAILPDDRFHSYGNWTNFMEDPLPDLMLEYQVRQSVSTKISLY